MIVLIQTCEQSLQKVRISILMVSFLNRLGELVPADTQPKEHASVGSEHLIKDGRLVVNAYNL
jgi:hypothetical protein